MHFNFRIKATSRADAQSQVASQFTDGEDTAGVVSAVNAVIAARPDRNMVVKVNGHVDADGEATIHITHANEALAPEKK